MLFGVFFTGMSAILKLFDNTGDNVKCHISASTITNIPRDYVLYRTIKTLTVTRP